MSSDSISFIYPPPPPSPTHTRIHSELLEEEVQLDALVQRQGYLGGGGGGYYEAPPPEKPPRVVSTHSNDIHIHDNHSLSDVS